MHFTKHAGWLSAALLLVSAPSGRSASAFTYSDYITPTLLYGPAVYTDQDVSADFNSFVVSSVRVEESGVWLDSVSALLNFYNIDGDAVDLDTLQFRVRLWASLPGDPSAIWGLPEHANWELTLDRPSNNDWLVPLTSHPGNGEEPVTFSRVSFDLRPLGIALLPGQEYFYTVVTESRAGMSNRRTFSLIALTEGVGGFGAPNGNWICNDAYSGKLSELGYPAYGAWELKVTKSPPTAATLAWFRAEREGNGPVTLRWQTLVEVETLGFQLARRTATGDWVPVCSGLVPSQAQNPQGQTYEAVDLATPATGELFYRLIHVDLRGGSTVLAMTQVTPASRHLGLKLVRTGRTIQVHVSAAPGAGFVLEASEQLRGDWAELQRGACDSDGACRVQIELTAGATKRFYRLRAP